MNRNREGTRMRPGVLVLVLGIACGGALSTPAVSSSSPQVLADSTTIETWQLTNGLTVVARHVPGANAVATTVAYPYGTASDPLQQQGLAAMVAEVAYFAAAGDVPERTRKEMDSLRPLGWKVEVNRQFVRFSEVGSVQQLPGILHQIAARMRNVKISARDFRAAKAQVESELARNYDQRADLALYYLSRELAAGTGAQAALRYGSGQGLRAIALQHVQGRIADWYTPTHGVLSLAGNLGSFDLHALIQAEFGTIPRGAGSRKLLRDARPLPTEMASATLTRPDIHTAFGTLGLIAPALGDSIHPSFYLHTLLVGSRIEDMWGPPINPLTTRFQYALLEDSELARFYPPVTQMDVDSARFVVAYVVALHELANAQIDSVTFHRLHRGVQWILGGPLTPQLARRARTDTSVLFSLASSAAARELWGDEFWAEYRRRFNSLRRPYFSEWWSYFLSPKNQVHLLFVPR